MDKQSELTFTFLGVGSANQTGLGHATGVIAYRDKKMLIDCGPNTTNRFLDKYQCLPDAIFVTHCHLDHIGDFENLFIKYWFHGSREALPKLFVPASIVPLMQQRVASYPNILAEGNVNFWDAFQLIPVGDTFYWNTLLFDVPEVRHHAPKSAYGLLLNDVFFYTGDTRPIPEIINQLSDKTLVFHDCGLIGNPSHTGIDDLAREYSIEQLGRMRFYHYANVEESQEFIKNKLTPVAEGEDFSFTVLESSQ